MIEIFLRWENISYDVCLPIIQQYPKSREVFLENALTVSQEDMQNNYMQTRLQCHISSLCHSFQKHLPGHLRTCNSKTSAHFVFLDVSDMDYKFPLEATIQSRCPPYLYEAQPYQNSCSSGLLHTTN